MLELVDLLEFEVIVAPELGVASSHGVGGFQQIVAEETVAGLDEPGMLRFEVTRLVLCPDEASVLGDGGLGLKTVDVADLGDDTGGVDLADAGYGSKRVWDDCKLLLNGFVQDLDLLFQCPHGSDGNGHCLIHGVVHGDGQAVGVSGGGLDRFRFGSGIGEVLSGFVDEDRQLVQIGVGQLVRRGKAFHEGASRGAAVCDIPILSETGAFEKQIVCEMLLLPCQGLDNAKSGSGERLQGFVAVIVHIDLPVHPSESEMVGDYKSVHRVVLRQIGIRFLKLIDLLWIEHMDLSLETSETSIFPERIDQRISVNRGGLQADCHAGQFLRRERRHDSLGQQFSTAGIVLHGKTAVLAAVRLHQVSSVLCASHINANV